MVLNAQYSHVMQSFIHNVPAQKLSIIILLMQFHVKITASGTGVLPMSKN